MALGYQSTRIKQKCLKCGKVPASLHIPTKVLGIPAKLNARSGGKPNGIPR